MDGVTYCWESAFDEALYRRVLAATRRKQAGTLLLSLLLTFILGLATGYVGHQIAGNVVPAAKDVGAALVTGMVVGFAFALFYFQILLAQAAELAKRFRGTTWLSKITDDEFIVRGATGVEYRIPWSCLKIQVVTKEAYCLEWNMGHVVIHRARLRDAGAEGELLKRLGEA